MLTVSFLLPLYFCTSPLHLAAGAGRCSKVDHDVMVDWQMRNDCLSFSPDLFHPPGIQSSANPSFPNLLLCSGRMT